MSKVAELRKWAKEILRFSSVKSQFVLYGNIYDIYPFPMEGYNVTLPLTNYIGNLLTKFSDFDLVIKYEPLWGFSFVKGDEKLFTSLDLSNSKTLKSVYEKIEQIVESKEQRVSVILDFSSRLPKIAQSDIEEFYYKMFRLSLKARPKIMEGKDLKYNIIIWLLEKENDIPPWYLLDNTMVKSLSIPLPDFEVRKNAILSLLGTNEEFKSLSEGEKDKVISLFVDQTGKMKVRELSSIITITKKEKISLSNIGEAIKSYKLGVIESPWTKIDKTKINKIEEVLKNRVMGQDFAIKKVSSIVKRAFYNLSGTQFSRYSQRPKGILFFAGPTGVGKTETAKALTEFLFGSETSYIRFDMSEFSREHADQRLIGAPPGYVGYDVGGELTNKVKENPFSIILFDEIEKAHPKIFDMFLQILDDGRLTSGRGETVYFSESVIIFTSNLGMYELGSNNEKIQIITPDMPYDEVKKRILSKIEEFFKYTLNRPEILNRIGENIVIYDFIRRETATAIFEKMLKNILFALKDTKRIELTLTEEAEKKLLELCTNDLSMGGRGIGNKLEGIFINPLSNFLFEEDVREGEEVLITDIVEKEGIWTLKGQRRL